jgi:peptidoglycan hydrolase-like protein with peptidoglycan-binding domain
VTRLAATVSLGGAVALGAVLAIALRGGAAAPAASPPPPVSTAIAVRTDLRTTVLTGGTLGYGPAGPVVNQLAGTYTELPRVGARIAPGDSLYRVDDQPVTLLIGMTPAWRTLALGMPDGRDVAELQSGLISLGYAHGLLSAPSGRYDWSTAAAVERWQAAEHEPVTGVVDLGDVVFLPAPVRVGAVTVAPGQGAAPGQVPFQVTTTERIVSVALNPNLPPTGIGERVSIVLASGSSTPGRIASIGQGSPVPVGGGAGAASPSTQLTVVPTRPGVTGTGSGVGVQVALTTSYVRHALAVPVSALLALAGGGYGVEVVEPSGAHRLVGVQTGMFAGARVQLLGGPGIGVGTKVVVAQ